MSDTISIVGATDTVVNPAKRSQAVTMPGEARRSTVLPRLQWNGPVPTATPTSRVRFEELSTLGRGGMGEVVLAKDHDIERTVAIKRLTEQQDLGLLMRFVDEIRIVGSLEHPNIVPVHDVGVDEGGRYYFVMKHLRGDSLESIIEKLKAGDQAMHDRFPFHVRVQVFIGVLNAMAYAHQQGIIHRDLKPANIMVGPYGEVTVMDWGLARNLATKTEAMPIASSVREGTLLQTQAGAVMGTPLYMSPEQARGEQDKLDVRTDVYSLAVVFHEFLYLEHYLGSLEQMPEILAAVQKTTPEMFDIKQSPHQPTVPAELGWFLLKGFEKDATKRFQNVPEMLEAMQQIIDGRVNVQCERTFAKRMLQEAIHRADAYPKTVIIGTGLLLSFILAGLVNSVMTFF